MTTRCSGCGDYVPQETAILDADRVVWCADCDEINRMVEHPTDEEIARWPADLRHEYHERKATR